MGGSGKDGGVGGLTHPVDTTSYSVDQTATIALDHIT